MKYSNSATIVVVYPQRRKYLPHESGNNILEVGTLSLWHWCRCQISVVFSSLHPYIFCKMEKNLLLLCGVCVASERCVRYELLDLTYKYSH